MNATRVCIARVKNDTHHIRFTSFLCLNSNFPAYAKIRRTCDTTEYHDPYARPILFATYLL